MAADARSSPRENTSSLTQGLCIVRVNVCGDRYALRREKVPSTAECQASRARATAATAVRRSNGRGRTREGKGCCTPSISKGVVLKRTWKPSMMSMLRRIMTVALFGSVLQLVEGGQCVFTQVHDWWMADQTTTCWFMLCESL